MTTYPNSPKLLKGAIVGFDLFNPLSSVVLFQYNPALLTRSITPKGAGSDGAKAESLRLTGAPTETIQVEVQLDATDDLEKAVDTVVETGIHDKLAALEMLLYPKSSLVIANAVLAAAGTLEIKPPESPFVLFVWGVRRIVPVRITEMTITEDAFDPHLNPIRAKVNINMQVLSYNDFSYTHPGFYTFLSHQVVKETMATISSVNDISATASAGVDAAKQVFSG